MADGSVVEQFDDFADTTRELIKNGKYLLVSVPEGGFIKSYVEGDQCIVVRHRDIVIGREPCQDSLVIYNADSLRPPNGCAAVTCDQNADGGNTGGDQSLVLPYDVEVMEGPDRIVPSLVRL